MPGAPPYISVYSLLCIIKSVLSSLLLGKNNAHTLLFHVVVLNENIQRFSSINDLY